MAWTKAKTAVVVGMGLVTGIGTVAVKTNYFPGEPSYEGRTLSSWLVDIDYQQPQSKRARAGEAVRKMGVKTLPFLLADLADEKGNDARYSQATWGFDALGPMGKSAIPRLTQLMEQNPGYVPLALAGIGPEAVPELLKALTNESFWVRDNATVGLANAIYAGKITPEEARAAFPIALENLQYENTNAVFRDNTRCRAAELLGALKLEPDLAVPALIQSLDDTNFSVVMNEAQALAQYGAQAKPAIPMLRKAANSTNLLLSRSVKFSLSHIEQAP